MHILAIKTKGTSLIVIVLNRSKIGLTAHKNATANANAGEAVNFFVIKYVMMTDRNIIMPFIKLTVSCSSPTVFEKSAIMAG
jgi:hypothetical protein